MPPQGVTCHRDLSFAEAPEVENKQANNNNKTASSQSVSSFQQVSSGGQDFAPPRVAQAPPVSSSVHSEEPSALLFSDTLLPVQRALGAEEGPVSIALRLCELPANVLCSVCGIMSHAERRTPSRTEQSS